MRYLHLFDPWNSPLCTCPKKYSIDPYTGCEHRCIYCYISSYIREPWRVRPKKDFLKYLEKDLKNAEEKLPISMSNSSDPYPKMETKLKITRGTLNLMRRYEFPALILTKSDLVVRDADLLGNMRSVVAITVTTLDENLAKKLEPMAPSPQKRMKTIETLSSKGIKTIVRLDPIIPGINDDNASLTMLVKEIANAGAMQIISSTYKAKPDNFKRVVSVFKDRAEYLKKIYFKENEIVRGVRYAPRELRFRILNKVRKLADEQGLSFSVCREGLPLNTAPTCDGSHLLYV